MAIAVLKSDGKIFMGPTRTCPLTREESDSLALEGIINPVPCNIGLLVSIVFAQIGVHVV